MLWNITNTKSVKKNKSLSKMSLFILNLSLLMKTELSSKSLLYLVIKFTSFLIKSILSKSYTIKRREITITVYNLYVKKD